jgi:hypothetical protein
MTAASEVRTAAAPIRGPLLLRALRTAWPAWAGPIASETCAIVVLIALVLVFRDDPQAIGTFGLLSAGLAFATTVGVHGIDRALTLLYPERPEERPALVMTAWLQAVATSCVVVAIVQFVGPAARLLVGERAAEFIAPYLWKAPALAYLAVLFAAMAATNSLSTRATFQALEAGIGAVFAVVGAVSGGLLGLVRWSFAGSVIAAVLLRPRRGGGWRRRIVGDLARRGRWTGFAAIAAALPLLVVLRLTETRNPADTAVLAVAAGLLVAIVHMGESVAAAVAPVRIGDGDPVLRPIALRLGFEVIAAAGLGLAVVVGAALLIAAASASFASLAGVALTLVPGALARIAAAASGATAAGEHRPRIAFAAAIGSALTALGVGALLVPGGGAVGGAAALSAAWVVGGLVLVAARLRRAVATSGPDTLDAVRRTADAKSFPSHVVDGDPRTLSLFSAAFLGRNDCIHLADGRVTDVLCVDLDDEKLARMRAIYPATWRFASGDAYVVAECLRASDERFDLVVVDGWTGEAERMLTRNLPLWLSLSRRWTLLMAPKPWFAAQEIAPEPRAVEEWARRVHGIDVTVESLHWRADWEGGVWWIVVRA